MAVFLSLFSAVLPVFLIVGLGYLGQRRFGFDVPDFVRLVLYFFVPFLVFDQVRQAALEPRLAAFALAFLTAYLSLWFIGRLLVRLLGLDLARAKTLLGALLFPNTGNMGLSLAFFAFAEPGLQRAVVYFLLATLVLFGLGPALYQSAGVLEGLGLTLRLPFFWALAAAFVTLGLGLPLAPVIERPVRLMGEVAIPMLLFGLGMQIARTPRAFGRFELWTSGLRIVFAPFVAYLVARGVGLEGLDLKVFTLISAMPVAVNTYMLAAEFGGDAEAAARVVALSTLLSFFTLPVVLAALAA